MLISLVGRSGSGKSSIAKALQTRNPNIRILDIDKIGHYVETLPEVQNKLITFFGQNVLTEGQIDRKKISQIVFTDDTAMNALTEITWPAMEKEIDQFILENSSNTIILDWQLLPKTKYFYQSNIKILVTAPLEIREERLRKRDKLTEEQFLARENAAMDFSSLNFDYIINNNGTLESEIEKIYEKSIISRKL